MKASVKIVSALLLLSVAAVGFFYRSENTVAFSELELREGLYYLDTEDIAFSGVAIERYENGAMKSKTRYQDGTPHGESLGYYASEQLQVREHFRNGVSHGLRSKWYQNGAKESEGKIVEGQFEGVFTRWDEAGNRLMEVRLKAGIPHGVSRSWYADGALKSEVQMEAGREISRKEYEAAAL